jgi:hypothetical protein
MSALPRKVPNGGTPASPRALQLQLADVAQVVLDEPDGHEQRALDQPIRHQVKHGAGQPLGRQQRKPGQGEADVADGRVRQHPGQVVLEHAHDPAHQRGRGRAQQQHPPQPADVGQGPGEHRPVDAGDRVQAQLRHHPGEQHPHRDRRQRVGVRQPEMERHHRRLDEEPHHQQQERDHHQPVGGGGGQRLAELGEVERAGAAVQQRDAGEHQEPPDGVGHREVERAPQRAGVLGVVAGQGVGGDAEQLVEHEQVEQVATQAEADDGGQEDQHEGLVQRAHGLEDAPRVGQRRHRQHPGEGREPGAHRVDGEGDAEGDAVARAPAAEPVDDRAAGRPDQQGGAEHGHRGGGEERHRVGELPPDHRSEADQGGGDQQGDGDHQGRQGLHGQSSRDRNRSGSRVPWCL